MGGINRKTKITISVDSAVFERFRAHCERHGMKISPRLNVLMRNSLEGDLQQQMPSFEN